MGLTLRANECVSVLGMENANCALSHLSLADIEAMGSRFVHIVVSGARIRKQTMKCGILCPQASQHASGLSCRESLPMMLTSTSVSFPVFHKVRLSYMGNIYACPNFPVKTSSLANGEIEWRESLIPQTYVSSNGVPTIATIGRHFSRSIAVASSRGLCVLDCSRMQTSNRYVSSAYEGDRSAGKRSTLSLDNRKQGRAALPKWKLFGEAEERSFQVIAMTWWEGDPRNKVADCNGDDLVLAIIERTTETGSNSERYLSCWSRRRYEL